MNASMSYKSLKNGHTEEDHVIETGSGVEPLLFSPSNPAPKTLQGNTIFKPY